MTIMKFQNVSYSTHDVFPNGGVANTFAKLRVYVDRAIVVKVVGNEINGWFHAPSEFNREY